MKEGRRWEMGFTDVKPSLFVPFGGGGCPPPQFPAGGGAGGGGQRGGFSKGAAPKTDGIISKTGPSAVLPPLFSPPYPGRAHERLLWPLFVAPEKGADRALTWNRRKSAGGLKTSRRRAKMGLAQRFEMQSHGFGTNGNLNKNNLNF